jgi:rhamnopyranosyl-N-acetylglucosaminyl-diphospho-decaprenol beta-1,3/1,4-galactofuranosyltransferase
MVIAKRFNVSCVIVSYCRPILLRRCIQAILAQSHEVTQILIVDNNSSAETLEQIRSICALSEKIKVEYLSKNFGGAGGFAHGIQYYLDRLNKESDFKLYQYSENTFLWLMDDDVYPDELCLETMLAYSDKSHCIHPLKLDSRGCLHNWHYLYSPFLGSRINLADSRASATDNISFTNVGCFEGCLVSLGLATTIGTPFAHYFISDDDTLYGYLCSLKTSVICVNRAIMHKDSLACPPPVAWKYYYVVRNSIYLFKDTNCAIGRKVSKSEKLFFYFRVLYSSLRNIYRSPKPLSLIFAMCRGIFAGLAYTSKISSLDY